MAADGLLGRFSPDHSSRKPNLRTMGYGENFATSRRGPWTH